MGMLSGIKYIFQIPLDWFRAVDAMVFGDHPGPGIKFDKSGDGSRAISVDYDELDARYEGKYVTLDTSQNISGVKTFENTVFIKAEKTTYFQIENAAASTRGYYGLGDVWLDKASGTSYIYFRNYGRDVLGSISFDRTNGDIKLTSGTNGHTVLDKAPADSTSTTAKDVVTLGYLNSKFMRKPSSAGVLVSDSNGAVSPSKPGASNVDLVLTYKSGASAPSWDANPSGPAENPTTKVNLDAGHPGNDAADTKTWTAGGNDGVTETVMTRTKWSGTVLYGYYRTKTYDKYGRLYSISAESRYVIDTPVTYNP